MKQWLIGFLALTLLTLAACQERDEDSHAEPGNDGGSEVDSETDEESEAEADADTDEDFDLKKTVRPPELSLRDRQGYSQVGSVTLDTYCWENAASPCHLPKDPVEELADERVRNMDVNKTLTLHLNTMNISYPVSDDPDEITVKHIETGEEFQIESSGDPFDGPEETGRQHYKITAEWHSSDEVEGTAHYYVKLTSRN